jgi:predicted DNA-binding antitoxin AbrB/MazE fold protein
MNKHVEAIYEGGVLKPLEPVSLPERQKVALMISWSVTTPSDEYRRSLAERRPEMGENVSLEQVRHALSTIEGSVSDEVIAERENGK